jgi:hypothetical protein
MAEEINVSEAMNEIQNATEDELRAVIEKWYEQTRTDGLKIGAKMISAAIYGIIQKHTKKASPSLRDYKRMTDEIIKLISVQLTKQEDVTNDGTEE